MPGPLLLLPDFLLIALGYLLCRHTPLDRKVWDGVERLVYYVLFPALLFVSIVRSPPDPAEVLPLASVGVGVTAVGIVLALAIGRLPGVDRGLHAAGAQTAFRFNSYVALAVAERIGGAPGLAWTALLVSLCVPLANIAAVWPMARQGGRGLGGELLRNPLIVSTVAGLGFNLLGLRLPELLALTGQRIGAAALPLGLMAVGAGLRLGVLREAPRLAAALLAIRHTILPLLAIALVTVLELPLAQQAIVVAFASLPTASSAYVLAVRMGNHGGFVAGLVTVSTMIGMAGLPAALWLLQNLQGTTT